MDPNKTNNPNPGDVPPSTETPPGAPPAADPTPPAGTVPAGGQGQGDPEGNGGTGTTPEGDAPEPQGAPEKYEPINVGDLEFPEDRMQQAFDYARQRGWSQEQLQSAVDTYISMRKDELAAERGLWAEMSEREFGAGFATIAEGAQRAIVDVEKVRPGITERLDRTNLGNHPDVLWLFNEYGRLAAESPMRGLGDERNGSNAKEPTTTSVLYPNESS